MSPNRLSAFAATAAVIIAALALAVSTWLGLQANRESSESAKIAADAERVARTSLSLENAPVLFMSCSAQATVQSSSAPIDYFDLVVGGDLEANRVLHLPPKLSPGSTIIPQDSYVCKVSNESKRVASDIKLGFRVYFEKESTPLPPAPAAHYYLFKEIGGGINLAPGSAFRFAITNASLVPAVVMPEQTADIAIPGLGTRTCVPVYLSYSTLSGHEMRAARVLQDKPAEGISWRLSAGEIGMYPDRSDVNSSPCLDARDILKR